jgi:hypothetical protein
MLDILCRPDHSFYPSFSEGLWGVTMLHVSISYYLQWVLHSTCLRSSSATLGPIEDLLHLDNVISRSTVVHEIHARTAAAVQANSLFRIPCPERTNGLTRCYLLGVQ